MVYYPQQDLEGVGFVGRRVQEPQPINPLTIKISTSRYCTSHSLLLSLEELEELEEDALVISPLPSTTIVLLGGNMALFQTVKKYIGDERIVKYYFIIVKSSRKLHDQCWLYDWIIHLLSEIHCNFCS